MSAAADDIPKAKGGGLVARYHNEFLRPILRRMRVRQTNEFRATPDGLVFRGIDSTEEVATETTFPLKIHVYNAASSGTPQWRLWCYYGTINGLVPTISGDAIGLTREAASLSIPTKTSTSDRVYFTGTLTADDSTLLYNATFSGFVIDVGTSVPADTGTTRSVEFGSISWSASGVPTPANANSHSVWIARAGGPGADYVTWAAS